jgi:biotin operon repressor
MENHNMTNTQKVAAVLSENTVSPGITASQLAKKTRMGRKSVMNRISELRASGEKIFSNVKRNKIYYRISA